MLLDPRPVTGLLIAALLLGCGSDGAGSPLDGGPSDGAAGAGDAAVRCPGGRAPGSYYPDRDGDGFGDAAAAPVVACEPPDAHVENDGDCDDTTAAAQPGGGPESCDDGLDNDCDGLTDYESEGCTTLEGCSPPATFTRPDPGDEGIPVADLALWLRADLGVSIDGDGRVCEWKDVSGSRNHFGQPVPDDRPLRIEEADGPSVRSESGEVVRRDDALGVEPASGRTLFVVSAVATLDMRSRPFWQGDIGTPGTYFGPEANTFNTGGERFGVYLTNNAYDSDVPTTTARTLHVVRVEDMTPGTPVLDVLDYRVDGTQTSLTRTPGGLGDGTIESIASFEATWVGAQFGGGTVVREVLLYARALNEIEIEAVETYLATRQLLTLP